MLKRVLLVSLLSLCALAHADEGQRNVVFVDTGNTGRSVSAEAIAAALIAQEHLHVVVISRALDANPFDSRPEANAVAILKRRGLDIAAHQATQLSANDVHHADVILTMTAKHKEKILQLFPEVEAKTFTLSEYALNHYDEIADAWGKPMPVYETMIGQLDQMVPKAILKAAAK